MTREDLAPCCVIRIPIDFQDGAGLVPKRFVVLGHQSDAAICVKTTSKTERFLADPSGVVFYGRGESCVFEIDTVIDPSNCFAIEHGKLESYIRQGNLEHMGALGDLPARMCAAIKENSRLEPVRKSGLNKLLGCP